MSPWQESNQHTLLRRLSPLRRSRPGILFQRVSTYNHIVVRRTVDQVLLCYRYPNRHVEEVESRLDPCAPLTLLSEYTRAILFALLWQPSPQQIFLIGLGGGRLQMVLHHYLDTATLVTVELDPQIPEVARDFFGLVPDERQRILVGDARTQLQALPAARQYQLIILDAYRVEGIPSHLRTLEFYADCRDRLASTGVVVTNLQSNTPLYDATRNTFAATFPYTAAFALPGGNVVVLGTRDLPLDTREIVLRTHRLRSRNLPVGPLLDSLPEFSETAPYRAGAPVLQD